MSLTLEHEANLPYYQLIGEWTKQIPWLDVGMAAQKKQDKILVNRTKVEDIVYLRRF